MDLTLDNWKFFASAGRFLEGRAAGEYMEGYTSMLRREPLGVDRLDRPVELPAEHGDLEGGPALTAGNTVVLKPSELTPYTALRLAELAADVLPPGVLNVVCGQGETAGVALVDHPDVAMVSLTGSVAAGKAIARASAETLKRVHLELGGKAPVVVFDDADPAAVAAGVRAAGYYNSGQDCTAACRVIAGPERARRRRGRPAGRGEPDPLRRPDRCRHRGRPGRCRPSSSSGCAGMVSRAADARRRGAHRRRRPPTAAASSTPRRSSSAPAQDSEIVQREVFGPVVTVQRCARRGDAARLGQRRRLRAGRVGVDHATWAGPCGWRPGCASAPCGSTTTSRS